MIRVDSIWLATEPMDMRAGTETALVRVVAVFGAAKPHCAYLFANRRANRMKVLVHDGVGIWLAARRLNQGRFFWPGVRHGSEVELDAEQLQALVLGLPWQRVGAGGIISMLNICHGVLASAIGPSVYRRHQPSLAKSAA
ncbi:IS66 family insertion sequence element accessory protein TnpB [Pseudomonas orientalis]|uniref:IS66 family insertion sequence element accessory protein TnpB n=1 Tax=Pseudomonas orientalis TaxID=76758 RepID=UPI001FAFE205|nr:IS66 family insertion sequence element accessory protein TnpB [Pseudomonas orientalis]UOB26515.1 IS66 family insertion sequence element accessory protein TnpB [Pseudomonas orientalis]